MTTRPVVNSRSTLIQFNTQQRDSGCRRVCLRHCSDTGSKWETGARWQVFMFKAPLFSFLSLLQGPVLLIKAQ